MYLNQYFTQNTISWLIYEDDRVWWSMKMTECENIILDKRGREGWGEGMGVAGIHFSYFSTKTCCGYSLEAPHQGASNE